FPHREHIRPQPIVTADGIEEFFINRIIDEHKRSRGSRYLVRRLGEGSEEDRCLPRTEV
ncbi:hypothetical protein IW262DRAFT_1249836, partial [Armillaria fumosa]